jgi:rhamnosyltransferase
MNGRRGEIGVLAPVCADAATGVPCLGLAWHGSKLQPVHPDDESAISLVDSVISSGSLIRREALDAAGLPRADFFMDFVDHEHCLRLRRHGFEIAIVRESRLQHSLGVPSRIEIAGRSKYWSDHAPWREYYMTRNEIFTMWKHYPRLAVKLHAIGRMARHGLEILLFGKEKLSCLRMMYRGFLDGRAGRLGIRSFAEAGRTGSGAGE